MWSHILGKDPNANAVGVRGVVWGCGLIRPNTADWVKRKRWTSEESVSPRLPHGNCRYVQTNSAVIWTFRNRLVSPSLLQSPSLSSRGWCYLIWKQSSEKHIDHARIAETILSQNTDIVSYFNSKPFSPRPRPHSHLYHNHICTFGRP